MVPSLAVGGATALAATVLLAVATRAAAVQRLDDAVEAFAASHRALASRFARYGTLPGERWVHPAMGAATALALWLARPADGALRAIVPLAAASLGAIVAHHAIKLVYARPRPAGALARGKTEAAFPSGHTTDATAVVFTAAALLARAGLVPLALGLAVAGALAAVTGVSRVALGWHWATDVLGGWLAGGAVAAGCLLLASALR